VVGASVSHGASLVCDDDTLSWFGSNTNDNSSTLTLDTSGPFYDELINMTVWNRCDPAAGRGWWRGLGACPT
jgi:hypothetical protein